MALTSIYGRTTNSVISGTLLRATSSTIDNMFTTQQQISTGRRILSASMDPLGAAEYLRYSQRSAANTGYLETINRLTNNYNFVDAQVGEAVDVANQVRQIALRESNDGASDADTRKLAVTSVANMQSSLMAIANAKLNGQSLFGGSNTTKDAFTAFGDALLFNGDFDVNQLNIENGLSFNTSLTANQVFGDITTVSAARNDLNVGLNLATISPTGSAQVSTSLASLNGGRGVDLGEFSIVVLPDGGTNPSSGVTYTADLRGAKTIADVAEILNNVRGRNGQPVFDVTTYEGFTTAFPQEGMSATSGLRITAVGEAAQATQGRPSEIQFIDKVGRSTARDLGLITGKMDFQFTSRELPTGPYAGPLNFDLKVNGQTLGLTVNPAAPMGIDELAAALDTEVNLALRTNSLFGFTAGVTSVDANGDAVNDSLSFNLSDASGTASFELVGTNPAALPLSDAIQNGNLTGSPSFTQNPASFTNGVFAGRDLNPALTLSTGISALNGGEGFQLETDASGAPVIPQGLRITNGSLAADINVADILSNPNATVGDLLNRINGAGLQVNARISANGDRIEIASKLVGVPMTVENINGSIATQMGIDSRFSEMRTIDLNDGRGLGLNEGADFSATATNGSVVTFDLGDANTVSGVVNAINNNAANVQPNGDPLFTAAAVTERTFSTGPLNTLLMAPGVSPVFQVSLDGSVPRTINLGGPHTTMDSLATAFESEMNRVASQLGKDGYSVKVNANNNSGRIDFQIQDSNGPAEIDFSGGFTAAFELDGSRNGAGVTMLHGEKATNRITLNDNTFDASTYVAGGPQPQMQSIGVSTVLEDLGISQSDAKRVQTIGSVTSFDPNAARTFTVDLARGPQLTVNVAAGVGRSVESFAADFDVALRAAVNGAGIQGMATSVRVDLSSGGVLVETTDGYNNASIAISGADAVTLGLDAANATVSSPSNVIFNVGTGAYEGKSHVLHGRAANNIFTSLNDLKNGLSSNSTNAIAATLGGLEKAINIMLDARGEAGSRVRRLTLADSRLSTENEHLFELSDSVMGVDIAEAATRLAQQENLFQAGIQATAKISRISLLDYI